jgi:hypothetical protein
VTVLLFAATGSGGGTQLASSTPIRVSDGGLVIANADGPMGLVGDGLTVELVNDQGIVARGPAAITLTELVLDPDEDLSRYTARLVAPVAPGTYHVVWTGPEADQSAREDVVVTIGIRPSVAEVGAILRARTAVLGVEIGTFDARTRPTDVQVDSYIDGAVDEVSLRLPTDLPDGQLRRFARRVIALRTAMAIEIAHDPDRTNADDSPYQHLKELFDSGLVALLDAAADAGTGGDIIRFASVPITTPTAQASALIWPCDLLP